MNFKRHFHEKITLLFALICNISGVTAGVPGPPPPPMTTENCNNEVLINMENIDEDAECSEILQGNGVIEGDSIRYSTTNTANQLGGGIRSGLGGGSGGGSFAANGTTTERYSGLAAGSGFNNVSVWGSYTRTHADDDFVSTAYTTATDNGLFGVDYVPMENMVLGVAFGYEDNDVKTKFNTGSQDISGFTIAPYIGYLISDSLSVDASFGYSDFDIDQNRTDPTSGTLVNGDTESDRWFTAINLNAFTTHNNWFLSGRVGIVYAEEDQDGYAESGVAGAAINTAVAAQKIEFGQFQIGGEAAYSFGNMEPFFGAYYEYDFEREDIQVNAGQARPDNDEDDIRFTAGVRYFSSHGFSGILQWDTILERSDYSSNAISLFGRYEF